MSSKFLSSSVFKKLLTSVTGFGLVLYVVLHLIGNLNLYRSDNGAVFNEYAGKLHGLGPFLLVLEIFLLATFLVHILAVLQLKLRSKRARTSSYAVQASKGGPSKNSFMSRNMAITGLLLLAFIVLHVWQMRFGPGIDDGYVVDINGVPSHDIYRVVVEIFSSPVYVSIYVVSMLVLGLHLRHGFWSAFQSIGCSNERVSKGLHRFAAVLAIILAGGFLFIPIWIYFGAQS